MTPLEAIVRETIASDGPLPVARYMALCLSHPHHGYYTTRDPLGDAGDFITAPEISQMFGELLGLWCADVWRHMGAPAAVSLVELGPGRGTLMADALRAIAKVPALRAALAVHLVETSPALRTRQRATLPGGAVIWHDRLEDVPEGPLLLLANEFLDALPVAQLVREPTGWHERQIGLDAQGRLAFGLSPVPVPDALVPPVLRASPPGTLVELSPERAAVAAEIARRVAAFGGAALVIDYGHTSPGPGDTLQAVKGHAFADPLAVPGEADLTAHVDFAALAAVARAKGAAVHGPTTQGAFLSALGIAIRAARLKASAPEEAPAIDGAVHRLTAEAEMGQLFKVLAIAHPLLPPLAGFEF